MEEKKKNKPSVVDNIIVFTTRNPSLELWHSGENAYVTKDGEHFQVDGSAFYRYVATSLYPRIKMSPSQWRTGLPIIEQKCFEGPEYQTHHRIARQGNDIYIDLGREFAHVTSAGWNVVPSVPVKFLRDGNTGLLPDPERGGSLDELRQVIHTDDENWPLIAGWILDACKGTGPYLVLVVNGGEGSAKTSLCRTLKALVDPMKQCDLLPLPRDDEAFGHICNSHHVLAFDNVSRLAEWQSDWLCRIAYGAGFCKRKLYTNNESILVHATKPQILNGIPEFATKPDLLSRSVLLSQPPIPDDKRCSEGVLNAKWRAIQGRVFGAILDRLVVGLATSAPDADGSRMASSCVWIAACGLTDFADRFSVNREKADEIVHESSPIVETIIGCLDTVNPANAKKYKLSGTASEILSTLCSYANTAAVGLDKDFPKKANQFSGQLTRDVNCLKRAGVIVEHRRSNGKRLIDIRRESIVPPSTLQ